MRKKKVEIEGGETINVGGEGGMVEGPSHEDGGIDMMLPEGTWVFSDRLKGPDGRTFAQREKRRLQEEAKAKKALERSPTDLISRFTLDRVLSRNQIAREAEMQIQNMAQETQNMKYGGKVEYKYGGKVKYPWGGIVGAMNNLNNMRLDMALPGTPRIYNMFNTGYQNMQPMEGLPTRNPFGEDRLRGALDTSMGKLNRRNNAGMFGNPPLPEDEFLTPTTSYDNDPFPFEPPVEQPKKPTVADTVGGVAQAAAPLLGPIGLGISAAAPLVTTLLNRLGDKPPVNQFEDFGRAGLESNAASMRGAAGARDMTKRDIDLEASTARNQARQSARGISTVRALDQSTSAQSVAAKAAANTQFYQNLSNLFAQRGQLQNQRDQVVMQGRKMAFDEREQQRDNFFTNLSKDFTRLGSGMMFGQKLMNKQPDFMKLWGK
jgi:hypothetical protein